MSNTTTDLWALAVGRDEEAPEGDQARAGGVTLMVYFSRKPSNDELRAFHDQITQTNWKLP